MFTAWMMANRTYVEGRTLTYVEFPSKFVYDLQSRQWKPRRRGFSIGRLSFVHPSTGELFYMRMLLNVQKGCTSFQSIRTVNSVLYDTFQEACSAMDFLIDDNEFVLAINEAAELSSGAQLRKLFVSLLISGSVSRQSELHFPGITMTDEELQTFCLIEIEKLLQANRKSLRDFAGMQLPNVNLVSQFSNSMVLRELEYDISVMLEGHDSNFPKLNEEQKSIYDRIIHCVTNKEHGRIAINVSSSGIASLLLPGGKTTHSMFGIPIELNEDTICRIPKDSPKADLIRLAELIIWDEAPMTNKLAFEALDRSFRDIMTSISVSYKDLPFGGKIIVLGGDFRQVLPVIPKASRAEIVMASINSSILWKHFEIVEGRIETIINEKLLVQIPNEFLIFPSDNPIDDIINAIYPNIVRNFDDTGFFQDRAILAPTVEIIEEINDHIVQLLLGIEKEYLSADSICGSDAYCDVDVDWINTKFLNQIKYSGLSNHSLKLKKGVPIILLRNIDPAGGLCNGTRFIVSDLGTNVIGAEIVSGSHIGDKVFIPRMNLIPSDTGIPFKFQRRQFSINLCFVMTINKSQGQTLSSVGLFLRRLIFFHGQLYVAISRVKSKDDLRILVSGEENDDSTLTHNIVFKEIFDKIL
ncbi:uncharacterized protein LOC130939707 [Arachis stenosperma]|uniref:uncharacterized protein LOC130939707 n=1 Tax=Arachis stenosperma TaxID=217475 RepID=UPI0025ABDBA0|nr:uncharacterized protein LOC130939707 [Arachis stenosperma]